MKRAHLHSELQSTLAGRVVAPFIYRDRKLAETVSIGIEEIDAMTGGLPRGGLTEICGPPCSGHTSLLLAALTARTQESEACALIDAYDAFDPYSADVAGVELKNLLWVRCRNADQSLRAADLVLQAGGFGLIALDLSDIPAKIVRSIPLNAWFRFRRAIEDTSTILLLLDQEPNAKTCASLVLKLGMSSVAWETTSGDFNSHSVGYLVDGLHVHAEVLRSRIKPVTEIPSREFASNIIHFADHFHANPTAAFETKIR
jgi:recombination protein RecA